MNVKSSLLLVLCFAWRPGRRMQKKDLPSAAGRPEFSGRSTSSPTEDLRYQVPASKPLDVQKELVYYLNEAPCAAGISS